MRGTVNWACMKGVQRKNSETVKDMHSPQEDLVEIRRQVYSKDTLTRRQWKEILRHTLPFMSVVFASGL